ncbi:MAG: RluA family pseudouridine synthase [Acetatifactor muris]|nr:RluA family pseudouridine synthase [Acetatifactor muris]MCM1525717.1 RluA family pseudouridine synthase [Bacteroides sp.]
MRTIIQYEDDQLIAAYKPAGFAVQTARVGQADMVSELKNYLKGGTLGVVHRLDQPVEGLLVFGKTKAATGALSKQLTDGTLNKHYYAVVCGSPPAPQGELTDYLRKTADNRAEIVDVETAPGKSPQPSGSPQQIKSPQPGGSPQRDHVARKAVLRYHLLESQGELSLMDVHIQTGRFHQIRAQMAHAGIPLLGDLKYGTEHTRRISEELGMRSVALCACELELTHPVKGERMRFQVIPKGRIFEIFESIRGLSGSEISAH